MSRTGACPYPRGVSVKGIHDWFSARPMIGDAVWAVLLLPLISASANNGTTSVLLGWVWTLVMVVPLLWRRTRPDVAAAGAAVGCLIELIVAPTIEPSVIVVPVVIYAVVAYGKPTRARWWLALALVGACLAGWRYGWRQSAPPATSLRVGVVQFSIVAVTCALTVLVAWFSGSFARARRLNLETLRRRAEDLERERDQRIRLATQEERTRIAREMHDIVAHSLSVIVVQADGGSYLAHHEETGDATSRLAAAASSLDTVAETARRALAETRRLVGVLRDDGDQPLDLAPAAGLDQIPDLVGRTCGALDVDLVVEGEPRSHPDLPQGAQLAVYRVVQESLTNVIKHAGAHASAHVRLRHLPEAVEVEVVDDGRGSHDADTAGDGHGLVGMRERVGAWGGSLEAGDLPAGGFRVHAVVPAQDWTDRRTS